MGRTAKFPENQREATVEEDKESSFVAHFPEQQ
jgi:hypothetical protein